MRLPIGVTPALGDGDALPTRGAGVSPGTYPPDDTFNVGKGVVVGGASNPVRSAPVFEKDPVGAGVTDAFTDGVMSPDTPAPEAPPAAPPEFDPLDEIPVALGKALELITVDMMTLVLFS